MIINDKLNFNRNDSNSKSSVDHEKYDQWKFKVLERDLKEEDNIDVWFEG